MHDARTLEAHRDRVAGRACLGERLVERQMALSAQVGLAHTQERVARRDPGLRGTGARNQRDDRRRPARLARPGDGQRWIAGLFHRRAQAQSEAGEPDQAGSQHRLVERPPRGRQGSPPGEGDSTGPDRPARVLLAPASSGALGHGRPGIRQGRSRDSFDTRHSVEGSGQRAEAVTHVRLSTPIRRRTRGDPRGCSRRAFPIPLLECGRVSR